MTNATANAANRCQCQHDRHFLPTADEHGVHGYQAPCLDTVTVRTMIATVTVCRQCAHTCLHTATIVND